MNNEPEDPRINILCADHIFQHDNEMKTLIASQLKNQDLLIQVIRGCNLSDGMVDPITQLSFEEQK